MKIRIASDVGGHVHRQHRLRFRVAADQRLQGADDAAGARGRHRREPAPDACGAGRQGQRGRLRRPRHDDGDQCRDPAQRRQDRLRHHARLSRPAADRAAGPAEPVRYRRRAHAAAGAARAVLRHRRADRCQRARDRAARPGRPDAGRRRHARPGRRGRGRGLPARLRQPRARARGQGGARAGAARRRHLHLDRHPARVPRVRARQHGRCSTPS